MGQYDKLGVPGSKASKVVVCILIERDDGLNHSNVRRYEPTIAMASPYRLTGSGEN